MITEAGNPERRRNRADAGEVILASDPKYSDAKRAAIRGARDLNRGIRAPDYPLTLYLEVSNVCNYKCAFCGSFSALNPKRFSMLKQTDRGFLDFDSASGNIDELIEHALTVYLFGFGEPTMHPQFADLIRYVGEREAQVEFVTNGLGLDAELANTLVEQRVKMINVSFSGATKSDYENVYLNGDFDRVLANIGRIAAVKRQRASRFPIISINSIGFRHHISRLPEFIDLMADAGANVIVVNALTVFSDFPELYHHAAVFNPERDADLLAEARRRAVAHGITLVTEGFERLVARSPEEEEAVLRSRATGPLRPREAIREVPVEAIKDYAQTVVAERPAGTERVVKTVAADMAGAVAQLGVAPVADAPRLHCYEPFRTAYVKRDGHVAPCCLWPDPQQSFGDLKATSGREIWNGPAFALTRAALIAGAYPANCHFCVRSRAVPEDAQLAQALTFIEWYREGFGVDLSADFGSTRLVSASVITSGLARADIPGWAQVAPIAEKQYGWDKLDRISRGLSDGSTEIVGYIDQAGPDGVSGWAYCPQYPEVNLPIEVIANGRSIGEAAALFPRPDLPPHLHGRYGFRVGVPFDPSQVATLEFRVPGTDFRSGTFPLGLLPSPLEHSSSERKTQSWIRDAIRRNAPPWLRRIAGHHARASIRHNITARMHRLRQALRV